MKATEKGAEGLEENNLRKGPEGKRTWDNGDCDRPSVAGGVFSYGQGAGNVGKGDVIPLGSPLANGLAAKLTLPWAMPTPCQPGVSVGWLCDL